MFKGELEHRKLNWVGILRFSLKVMGLDVSFMRFSFTLGESVQADYISSCLSVRESQLVL